MRRFGKTIAIGFVKFYQLAVSPFMGNNCRFMPTCSSYAIEAIHKYGAAKGSWLAIKRISRCRPGGGHGLDPLH
jgi:uncharacterized protein